jgi:C4-dicarboxylate-specific signal transduction histidine kinase
MVLRRLLPWHGFSAVAPTWPSGARGTPFVVAGGRTNGLFRSDTADRQQLRRTVLARRPHGVVARQPLFCHADRLALQRFVRNRITPWDPSRSLRTHELAKSLEELRAAQDRLIVQSEKLASLGQLTAEIKKPLNFRG